MCLALSVAGAFAGLLGARYLGGGAWIDALVVLGGSLGATAALVAALVSRHLLGRERGLVVVGLLVAAATLVGRAALIEHVASIGGSAAGAGRGLAFAPLAIAASTVVWGALALVWGAAAAMRAGATRVTVACGLAGATAGLYGLTPLWRLFGLRLDHRTGLGLLLLAIVAHGAAHVWHRLVQRAPRQATRGKHAGGDEVR